MKAKKIRKIIILFVISFILTMPLQLFIPHSIEAITLKELGNNIAKLSNEEQQLIEEIVASEAQVKKKQDQLSSLNSQLKDYEVQLEDLYSKRIELKESIKRRQELLTERIVYTYKYGRDDVAKFVLSAKNINEIVNNLYLFKNIMEKDAKLIEQYRYDKEEFERVSRKSEEKKKEMEQLKEKIIIEEQNLQKSIQENKALLERVKSERSEIENLLNEVKKRIAKIQPPGLTLVGEWEMVATAYYSGGGGLNGNGITAIGLSVKKGIVAVDPKIIPLGTRLFIPGYGEALAADTGGWIKGKRIDLAFDSLEECYGFGRRKLRIYLVEN
ncbi:MAG: 3D domain-containing protein [Candidatus Humimicrobiaceae bacterium]